jgi:hypothetical protein
MKIVQVISASGMLRNGNGIGSVVLAEDGTVWRLDWDLDTHGRQWVPVALPPLPLPETFRAGPFPSAPRPGRPGRRVA